jgi:hypothetical protein
MFNTSNITCDITYNYVEVVDPRCIGFVTFEDYGKIETRKSGITVHIYKKLTSLYVFLKTKKKL